MKKDNFSIDKIDIKKIMDLEDKYLETEPLTDIEQGEEKDE